MKKDLILVVGASGVVGSELVRQLKAEGHPVRVTTGKPVQGDNQVQVDLRTDEGLHEAFDSVEKAFLLSPSGFGDQYAILGPLIQETKRRGLKKVVLMTAFGANASDASPLRRAEIELENSGLNYNILRPNWFMQNFNTFWVEGIRGQSRIELPAGQARTSFIDTRDIAAVAAALLTSDRFDNQAFDLTGPQGLSHDEVARRISAVTGKHVTYGEIEPEMLHRGLIEAGLPRDYTDFLITIFGFLKEGYNAKVTSAVKQALGREPRTFEEYVRDYRSAWV